MNTSIRPLEGLDEGATSLLLSSVEVSLFTVFFFIFFKTAAFIRSSDEGSGFPLAGLELAGVVFFRFDLF